MDKEIADALDGVDLQAMDSAASAARGPGGRAPGGDRLYPGSIVGVHGDDVIVELGPQMQGVCSRREFDEEPNVGDVHRFTLRGRDEELWILSIREAKDLASWEQLEVGAHTKARVTGQNQGGLALKIGTHDAFMPTSQVSTDRNFDVSSLLGQTITAEVLEIDRSRKRVLLSRRKIEERERMERMAEAVGGLSGGTVMTGKVTRIEAFGAFVDVGNGLEGLVHVSNISRKRVEDVNTVLTAGQTVQVMVLDIMDGGRKLSLGMKQLEPDPWNEVTHLLSLDQQVTGKVTRIAEFGAFVEVLPGIEGLLHVSQFARERVRDLSRLVKVGEELAVRITALDPSSQRISLSRLDARGAVLGSEDSVDSGTIDSALEQNKGAIGTNLGALLRKARDPKS
ncbi:MAG: S1 RNA-binding domain-containing protein [Planctomycetota bacterium]